MDASPSADAPLTGLVGYWAIDEGTGDRVADLSGLGHHGTFVGSLDPVTAWQAGKVGAALEIPDQLGAAVSVPAGAAIQAVRNAFTISAWVYRKADLGNRHMAVLSRQYGTASNEVYTLAFVQNDLIVWMHDVPSFSVRADRIAPLNTWIHVAATWDGSLVRIYQDGEGVGSGTFTDQLPASTSPLLLGNNANQLGFDQPLAGILDEVRLYDRALSEAEVRILANPGGS